MNKIKNTIVSKLHNPHDKKTPNTTTIDIDHHHEEEDTSTFEVVGLMRSPTRQNTGSGPETTRPNIERHISQIPQRDHDDGDALLPPRIKRNISNIPAHDYDSSDEDGRPPPVDANALHPQQRDERTGSELEEPGLLRITSDDADRDALTPVNLRPGIERHVSAIPAAEEDDEEEKVPGRRARLERTISQIPTHDYDSDGEGAY